MIFDAAKKPQRSRKRHQRLSEEDSYKYSHRAPDNDGYNAPMHNVAPNIYPADIYSAKAAWLYGDHAPSMYSDQQSVNVIQAARNKPDMIVAIYRAVPSAVKAINPGDWVTINLQSAKQHAVSNLTGKHRILKMRVPAKHLYTDGNSIHEWGYDPS